MFRFSAELERQDPYQGVEVGLEPLVEEARLPAREAIVKGGGHDVVQLQEVQSDGLVEQQQAGISPIVHLRVQGKRAGL